MTKEDSLIVIKEYQKWRKGEPPYHDTDDPDVSLSFPYTTAIVERAFQTAFHTIGSTKRTEQGIIRECFDWIRSRGKYEGTAEPTPFTQERLGQAIDVMIEEMSKHLENED